VKWNIPPQLLNIASGRAADEKTKKFLLNVFETGKNQKEKFILECSKDGTRFHNSIKRNDIDNFSLKNKKYINLQNNPLKEVTMERDIISRMLHIISSKNVDIKKIFNYPLTPVPLSLAHFDGMMHKTNKSVFLKHLEKQLVSQSPPKTDILIIDGFYFFHLLFDIPSTFGKLALFIMEKLCKTEAQEVHLVFDSYKSPSIKDCERSSRANEYSDVIFSITGPDQKCPSNFVQSLRSNSFKTSLISFLIDYFENDIFCEVIKSKKIYVTNNSNCFSYQFNGNNVKKTFETRFCSTHEEADSKILHDIACVFSRSKPKNCNQDC
jgi:hypothetical protein